MLGYEPEGFKFKSQHIPGATARHLRILILTTQLDK